MALSLLPSLLDLIGLAESSVWRLSSAAAGLTFALYIVTQFRRRRRVESGRPPLRVFINFTLSMIAVVGLWLNASGILFQPSLGPYVLSSLGATRVWIDLPPDLRSVPRTVISRLTPRILTHTDYLVSLCRGPRERAINRQG